MLATGFAALGFTVARQQDLPPSFGTRSILQRVGSENSTTYNASWRSGPVAGVVAGGVVAATGGAAAAHVKSWGPGWAPSPAPPIASGGGGGGRAASTPPPPAAPPPAIDMTSPAAQAVFAVASGALGLLFVLLGQRVWRAFLALSALFATGLLAFYLLLHNVAALPLWADGVIAGCLGALAAALAFFFSVVGLLACSGAAGFLLTWAILRVSHLAAVLDDATPG